MKRVIEGKTLTSLLLALSVTCSMILCSCSKPEETAAKPTEEPAVATTEPADTSVTDTKDNTSYEKIELDGNAEHKFTASGYSYVESDKFVLLLEKDVCLPGDFADNLSAIIDEIEKETGLNYAPDGFSYTDVPDMSWHYNDTNPWADWNIGKKIPIFVCADYNDDLVGSVGNAEYVRITQYDLFSDELWNSVYKDMENREKLGYVDYVEITTHITTHIAYRNNISNMPGIMLRGIGVHMSYTVPAALGDKYPNIKLADGNRYSADGLAPEAINADNAEEIFTNDYFYKEYNFGGIIYENITLYAAQDLYGKYFCRFLSEQYGSDFYKKISDAMNKDGAGKEYAKIIKTTFSDEDIFTKFGDWCVKNNYLQGQ